jgi:hypothetical protein
MRIPVLASTLVTIVACSGALGTVSAQTASVTPPPPASAPAPQPPAAHADGRIDTHWLRAGTDTMIMTRAGDISSVSFRRGAPDGLPVGPGRHEIGMTIQTVRGVTDQLGRRAIEVAFEERDPNGVVEQSTTWVDGSTLLPLRQEARLEEGRVVTLVYGGGQALGVDVAPGRQSHTFNTPVPDSAFTSGALDLLLRALPLAADYRTTVPVYFPADQLVYGLAVRVVGRETIMTRAGRPADCWLVAADFPGSVTEQFWIEQSDHTLVRILAHDSPTTLVRYDR